MKQVCKLQNQKAPCPLRAKQAVPSNMSVHQKLLRRPKWWSALAKLAARQVFSAESVVKRRPRSSRRPSKSTSYPCDLP